MQSTPMQAATSEKYPGLQCPQIGTSLSPIPTSKRSRCNGPPWNSCPDYLRSWDAPASSFHLKSIDLPLKKLSSLEASVARAFASEPYTPRAFNLPLTQHSQKDLRNSVASNRSLKRSTPVLSRWMSSLEQERNKENFSSVMVFAELRMRETIQRTADMPRPNRSRCAVAFELLFGLKSLFSRYEDLLALIADEILCSCYPVFRLRNANESPPTRTALEAAVPFFDLSNSAQTESANLQDELRAVQKDGEASAVKLSTQLAQSMEKIDKRALRNTTFRVWKGYFRNARLKRRQLRRRCVLRLAAKWFSWHRDKPLREANRTELDDLRIANSRLLAEANELQGLVRQQEQEYRDLQMEQETRIGSSSSSNSLLDCNNGENTVPTAVVSRLWLKLLGMIKRHNLESVESTCRIDRTGSEKDPFAFVSINSGSSCSIWTQTEIEDTACAGVQTDLTPENDKPVVATDRRFSFAPVSPKKRTALSFMIPEATGTKDVEQPKRLGDLVDKKGKAPKEISVQLANALIISIYEAKIKQDQDDLVEGRPHQPLPELARDILIRKYGIKRLASKALRSLVALCKKAGSSTARLRLFSGLCAIPTDIEKNEHYSTARVGIFGTLMSHLFKAPKDVGLAMGSKQLGIDRDLVMTSFANTFVSIRKRGTAEYKQTARALLTLPADRVIKLVEGSTTKLTLINVDDAIEIMMKAWEFEFRQRSLTTFMSKGSGPVVPASPGSCSPNKRQSTLLGSLLTKFSLKQKDAKAQREERLEALFIAFDNEHNSDSSTGELTLEQFQQFLAENMHIANLASRDVLELYNEWEDSNEEIDEECVGNEVQAERAKAFVSLAVRNGLLKEDASSNSIILSPARLTNNTSTTELN